MIITANQRAPLTRIPKGPPAAQVYAQWQRQGAQNRIKISPLEKDGMAFMLNLNHEILARCFISG